MITHILLFILDMLSLLLPNPLTLCQLNTLVCNPSPSESQHNLTCFTYLHISPQLLLHVESSLKCSSAHCFSHLVIQWNPLPHPRPEVWGLLQVTSTTFPYTEAFTLFPRFCLCIYYGLVLEKFPKELLD